MADKQTLLRSLPAVTDLLQEGFLAPWAGIPRPIVVAAIQREIASARERLLTGELGSADLLEKIKSNVAAQLAREAATAPRTVINATGVMVHTNLGRSPLAASAADHVREVAARYSALEYDLEKGERGSRQAHLEESLKTLLGCSAALAVNNNAAAIMLVLATLAPGREVIVSRGELVEIGGSFRVPDILRASGAALVEVGTTNRTSARDYASAITPHTALLLKVHPSNFRITGFTSEATLEELGVVARAAAIPLVFDAGSGAVAELGLPGEPDPKRALASCDLVTFSADKLMGGPQAGIIAGRAELIERLRKHPLARAVRIDKLSLAALAQTLRLLLDPARQAEIPVLRMIREPLETVRARAETLAKAIAPAPGLIVEVVESRAEYGGGSAPGETLPSFAVALRAASASALERALRGGEPPVIGRVKEQAVLLDVRAIAEAEVGPCADSVNQSIRSSLA